MKTGNDMMLLNLIILQKLLRIFVFVILISRNPKQKIRQNETTKSQVIYSRDFASKQKGNMIIHSLFLAYYI